jgi:hypothetical protein
MITEAPDTPLGILLSHYLKALKLETGNFSGVGHGLLGSNSPSPSF